MVAGVAGGVGASTVAVALRATDCGLYRAGHPVDVVVARDTVVSLGAAHRVVNAVGNRPLLVVVASTSSSAPKASVARVEMVRPYVAGVIIVPYVARWREVTNPWQEAAEALAYPEDAQLPKWLRGFASAMRQLRSALVERLRATPAPPPSGGPAPVRPPQTYPSQA